MPVKGIVSTPASSFTTGGLRIASSVGGKFTLWKPKSIAVIVSTPVSATRWAPPTSALKFTATAFCWLLATTRSSTSLRSMSPVANAMRVEPGNPPRQNSPPDQRQNSLCESVPQDANLLRLAVGHQQVEVSVPVHIYGGQIHRPRTAGQRHHCLERSVTVPFADRDAVRQEVGHRQIGNLVAVQIRSHQCGRTEAHAARNARLESPIGILQQHANIAQIGSFGFVPKSVIARSSSVSALK